MKTVEHEYWMRRALALARRGEGMTRPNPPVGAVLVKNGRVVGEGYHRKAGGPHAEIYALQQAGSTARGATLYVTLEPCSTWGRTPPCTDAILQHGVKSVVIAARDPNPKHAGRGVKLLLQKNIKVIENICAADGRSLIEPFETWVTRGQPFVTLKLGMTLDGKIADAKGCSKWITGPAARERVQDLRRRADAVMVGGRTAIEDEPSLLPRPPKGRRPWRVIVAGREKLPESDGTLVYRAKRGGVSLPRVMKDLAKRGVLHVVCEGGGALAASLIKAKLVDEFWIFVAPVLLGGKSVNAVGGRGWPLAGAPRLKFVSVENVGEDILIRARPSYA